MTSIKITPWCWLDPSSSYIIPIIASALKCCIANKSSVNINIFNLIIKLITCLLIHCVYSVVFFQLIPETLYLWSCNAQGTWPRCCSSSTSKRKTSTTPTTCQLVDHNYNLRVLSGPAWTNQWKNMDAGGLFVFSSFFIVFSTSNHQWLPMSEKWITQSVCPFQQYK